MPGTRSRLRLHSPLVLRWDSQHNPLPVRTIRPTRPVNLHPLRHPAPWLFSGPPELPFDFTGQIRRLCQDVVQRCEELRHIQVDRLLFCVTQARSGQGFGLQARVTPLRFPGGRLLRQRRGVTYQVQRYFHGETEFLYLITFCLPRFLDQDFDSKLVTIFHELYHISPLFDGDLRRHAGRYAIHSHSQRDYDIRMAELARQYMQNGPNPEVVGFCRLDFAQLVHRHGAVTGVMVPHPKVVPVAWV